MAPIPEEFKQAHKKLQEEFATKIADEFKKLPPQDSKILDSINHQIMVRKCAGLLTGGISGGYLVLHEYRRDKAKHWNLQKEVGKFKALRFKPQLFFYIYSSVLTAAFFSMAFTHFAGFFDEGLYERAWKQNPEAKMRYDETRRRVLVENIRFEAKERELLADYLERTNFAGFVPRDINFNMNFSKVLEALKIIYRL